MNRSGRTGKRGRYPAWVNDMKLLFLFWLTVVTTCSVGCGFGMPDRNVSRTIEPSELIGKWKLTGESLAHLIADGYTDEGLECTIVFRADSTAKFFSINDLLSPPLHQDKSGFWEIGPGAVNGETRVTISDRRRSEFGFVSFGFTEDRGKLRLWNFRGDPDMWEFIEYTKVK